MITDRTIIDVMSFCELSDSMNSAEKQHINGVLWHLIKEYDIIFYVSPEGVDIEDNGVRETNSNYRDKIDKKIKSILSMHKHMPGKVIKIKGNTEERINKIKEAVFS